jgi:hypothetical protein
MATMSLSSLPPERTAGAALHARGVSAPGFFAASGLLYGCTIVAATLTLNVYFAQTWDVNTFIHAARHLFDGNPWDLYAASRAAQTWPFAYPPLHALAVAIALLVGDIVCAPTGVPDYVWVRVPPALADIGVAVALYVIVRRKSNDESLARVAALLWLFNPVTFYDTAVQGHFESEWLLFVLLAYAWSEDARGIALPTIALAIAVLFKQIAILFALPLWAMSLRAVFLQWGLRSVKQSPRPQSGIACFGYRSAPQSFDSASLRSGRLLAMTGLARLAFSLVLFVLIVVAMCLPFLLHSDDFVYMNFTYVENVPVQTQSWIVGLLGVTRASPQALTSDFFLLRYQTIVTALAAVAITFLAMRRGWSLYLTATLIALVFFLTSKKVMGYYYVMLLPFLFVEALPKRRFDLALLAIVVTTWISLSPYYASWSDPAHWWIYALMGTANSLFFVWLFAEIGTRMNADERGEKISALVRARPRPINRVTPCVTLFVTLGLFAGAALTVFLQPFAPKTPSPIRAPILAPGTEWTVAAALTVLIALMVIALAIIARTTRDVDGAIPRAAWGIVLIFAPLFFAAYCLTKESTAVFEILLKALGV